jgi:hypothetical protein
MTIRPNGPELLGIARATFLEQLLPHLPRDLRYTALMVANAMAVAARDAELRAGEEAAELAMLGWLYGEESLREAGRTDEQKRHRLRRRLAREIREGHLDRMLTGRLHTLLQDRAVARLRISNPKYLQAAGIAGSE